LEFHQLCEELFTRLNPGKIEKVIVGLHLTMVVARVHGESRAGLASTVKSDGHHHRDWHDVHDPGNMQNMEGEELARLMLSMSPVEHSIGLAAVNALLPRYPDEWLDLNAEEIIARAGRNKCVVLAGHFPFVKRLADRVGELVVLELDPRGSDLPADQAPEWVPRADILAMTSVTLLNGTLGQMLSLRRKTELTMLVGPSTPLTPVLQDLDIQLLSGSIVTDIPAVASAVIQGGDFRQVRRAGVRLVTVGDPAKLSMAFD